jgi:hypothetical protein
VFLAFLGFLGWLVASDTRVAAFPDADRALAQVVSRTLDVRDGLAQAPAWERRLYEWGGIDGSSDLAQAIEWYEELASQSLEPSVDLHLAILEAEAGRLDRFERRLEEWQRRDDPLPAFADLLATAYLDSPDEAVIADSEVLGTIDGEWFRDRVVIALVRRAGLDATPIAEVAEARSTRLLWTLRGLAGVELAFVVAGGVGLVVLVLWRRRQPAPLALGNAPLPPPWPFGRGVAVLIRGGAAGALVAVVLFAAYQFVDHPLDELLAVPMTYLPFVPVLLLAGRHLATPAGLGLADALGLRVPPGRWSRMLLVAVALCAAGIVGEWLLGLLGQWRGVTSHWTEWFDRDLVWGTPAVTASAILGAIVVAPIVEEIVFRGLVFGTLRRRLPWPAAALLSAALFAFAHGYGALGFAAVLWSGAVWAYAYERTGSLWPGIIAHAANNAAATATVISLLRF